MAPLMTAYNLENVAVQGLLDFSVSYQLFSVYVQKLKLLWKCVKTI